MFLRPIYSHMGRVAVGKILSGFILITCLLCSQIGKGQHIRLYGSVVDTSERSSLSMASVILSSAKDSILYTFLRTDKQGNFSIMIPDTGVFIMEITYPNYVAYTDHIRISGVDSSINTGVIPLVKKSILLKTVLINSKAASIKIKGDTTEFNAANYKVREGATVEELLKKLPGIKIDRNGTITAQGEQVKRVLVDGEEFFGSDPTLVTRNLAADLIGKVQVYDKKSDQAAFTGIDDGSKEKVIDVKLKEEKKTGSFGKIEVGGGFRDMYSNQLLFNTFKGKRKISLYATVSNTGTVDVGSDDKEYIGINSSNIFISDQGLLFKSQDNDDGLSSWNGVYSGMGIPKAISAGLHYNNAWQEDAFKVNGNYQFGKYDIHGEQDKKVTTTLPSGIQQTVSKSIFTNSLYKNKLDGNVAIALSPSSKLNINLRGYADSKKSAVHTNGIATSLTDTLNNISRSVSNDEDDKDMLLDITWNKKFGKPRRMLSINVQGHHTDYSNRSQRDAAIRYYSNNMDSAEIINQFLSLDSKSSLINTSIAYTEPISASSSILFKYYFLYNHTTSERYTFNAASLDSLFSSNYVLSQHVNIGGISYNYKKNKGSFSIGVDGGGNQLKQDDGLKSYSSSRTYTIINPNARFAYGFSQQANISVSYKGITKQPEVTQLQPVYNNDDPLNIYVGNQNLKTSFNHGLTVMFTNYREVKKENYIAFVGANLLSDPIVLNVNTDEFAKSTYQYINLRHYATYNYFINGIYKKYFDSPFSFEEEASIKNNKFMNIINQQLNTSHYNTYSLKTTLNLTSDSSVYDFSLSYMPQYNYIHSSYTALNSNFWNHTIQATAQWSLTKTFLFESVVDYFTSVGSRLTYQNFDRLLINCSLSKSFFKDNSLSVKVSVNDLLNRNRGFEQFAIDNTILHNNYTVLKRFFMISAIWNFKRSGNE